MYSRLWKESAHKTSNPPPTMPNRTAPPAAKRLAEKPAAAPPVAPVPVGLLVGLVADESRLLTEETREETLERTEDKREEILLVGKLALLEREEEAERDQVNVRKSNDGRGATYHRREQLEDSWLAQLLQGYSWPGGTEGRLADIRC